MLKIGLSLAEPEQEILGRTADPQRWAILYLGSAQGTALAPDREVILLDKKGNAEAVPGCGVARTRKASSCSTAPGARPRRCGGATPGCSSASG